MKPIKSKNSAKQLHLTGAQKKIEYFENKYYLNHTRRREGTRRGTIYEGQGH